MVKNFEWSINYLQNVPDDTVFISIDDLAHLNWLVAGLVATKHVFVVSPTHQQVAMSRAAHDDLQRLYNA